MRGPYVCSLECAASWREMRRMGISVIERELASVTEEFCVSCLDPVRVQRDVSVVGKQREEYSDRGCGDE